MLDPVQEDAFHESRRLLLTDGQGLDLLFSSNGPLTNTEEEVVEECYMAIRHAKEYNADGYQADLIFKLAGVFFRRGESQKGDLLLEETQNGFFEAGNFELAAEAGLNLFDWRQETGISGEDLEKHLQKTLTQAAQTGGRIHAALLLRCGDLYVSTNRRKSAVDYYKDAREIFRSFADHRGVAHALVCLGGVLQDLGRSDDAVMQYRESLEICVAVGDASEIAFAKFRLARGLGSSSSAYQSHRVSEALNLLTEANAEFKEEENLKMMAECDSQAAMLLAAKDGPSKAIPIFERAATLFNAVGAEESLLTAQANLATEYWRIGDVSRAENVWKVVIENAEKFGNQFSEAVATISMVRKLIKTGRLDESARMLDGVAEIAISDVPVWRAQYWLARAELFQGYKSLVQTKEAVREAYAALNETMLPEEHAEVLEILAWCADADGETEKAGRLRGEALALYTKSGEIDDAYRVATEIKPAAPTENRQEEEDSIPLYTGVYL